RQLVGDSDPGSPPGISAVMVDAFNIVQDRIARSRLAGDPPDITISPQVGQIGLFEFHRAAEAIEIGARASERVLANIDDAVVALS
ncbi:MAG TPA: phospholipase, partial [Hyphomicrobiales bacterium]|nr:phospholipase [Hyphomicrobiales bacterium]